MNADKTCMLPPSVFSRKDKKYAMRYKTTNNKPHFKDLEIPLLADCRRCQRKKASTLRQLIDAAQYCISRYANSGHVNRMICSQQTVCITANWEDNTKLMYHDKLKKLRWLPQWYLCTVESSKAHILTNLDQAIGISSVGNLCILCSSCMTREHSLGLKPLKQGCKIFASFPCWINRI